MCYWKPYNSIHQIFHHNVSQSQEPLMVSTTDQRKCEDKVTKFQLPISAEQKITPQGQGANKTLEIVQHY